MPKEFLNAGRIASLLHKCVDSSSSGGFSDFRAIAEGFTGMRLGNQALASPTVRVLGNISKGRL
jgi:hypothetical protein